MEQSDQGDLVIAALIEQLARQVQNICFTKDLAPVQWSALRYFAKAGPSARTVSGLTAYSGVNQSSATRTVQLLLKKGLIEIQQDRRFKRISLTDTGRDLLLRDPLKQLADAVQTLASDDKRAFGDTLATLLLQLYPRPFRDEA